MLLLLVVAVVLLQQSDLLMPLKIVTWNVNSIRARLSQMTNFLTEETPDIVLLQEIKVEEKDFPYDSFQEKWPHIAVAGQKSYHGVAILSKYPMENILNRLPGDEEDSEARYLEADIAGCRVASLYLPNGNGSPEKYDFKLRWMDRLYAHVIPLLSAEKPVVLGGDYNVIPEAKDCYDSTAWQDDALYRLEIRKKFRSFLHAGYYDAFRVLHTEAGQYSFWDYQGGAWQKDAGIRIDHFLLSPQAADCLEDCKIHRKTRGQEKASDHVPVMLKLDRDLSQI